MTMQVAFVGSEGIVLATDTQSYMDYEIRTTCETDKILVDKENGLAVACAQGEISHRLAQRILQEFKEEWREYPLLPLEKLGQEVMEKARSDGYGDMALVGQAMLILLSDLSRIGILETDHHLCRYRSSHNKAHCGDMSNPAIMFSEAFYKKGMAFPQLARLAAQVVVSAHHFNENGIDGLKILLCRSSGFEFMKPEEIQELEERSEDFHKQIGVTLLAQSYAT
jgi:20S proteasome alpha/beta subunit